MTKAKEKVMFYSVYVCYNQGEKLPASADGEMDAVEYLNLPTLEKLIQKHDAKFISRSPFKDWVPDTPPYAFIIVDFVKSKHAARFKKECKNLEGVIDVSSDVVTYLPSPLTRLKRA
ncbi:MAG: hypothetical protein AABW48_02900 [Nanoarchaeota archaeon]